MYLRYVAIGYTQITAIDTHCVTTEARGNATGHLSHYNGASLDSRDRKANGTVTDV